MNFKKMTFLCMQKLTNFPYIEADFDALTNYELLCKVVEYLNKVIANENAQNEALNELAEAFNNLKTYVDNYFDNLDVQEEINNKLDEMAESGQLTDIIAQYLGLAGMIAFDTVADMKLAENLVNGSKCRTLGFHSVNDGGGAYYKIRTVTNDDVIDEKSIIAVYDDLLVAELIPNDPINVKQFGAYGDGINNDTLTIKSAIEYAISFSSGNPRTKCKAIYLPTGTYKIEKSAFDVFKGPRVKGLTFYGDGRDSSFIKVTDLTGLDIESTSEATYLFDSSTYDAFQHFTFYDLCFDTNNVGGILRLNSVQATNYSNNHFNFNSCQFITGTLFRVDGTFTGDFQAFRDCVCFTYGDAMILNNGQAVCNYMYNNSFLCYKNLLTVLSNGGGDAVFTSCSVIILNENDETTGRFAINLNNAGGIGPANGNYIFNSSRFEFGRYRGPVSTSDADVEAYIQFNSCQFNNRYANTYQGVIAKKRKTVVFNECTLATAISYYAEGERLGATPGLIIFDKCIEPSAGLKSLCTISGTGRIIANNLINSTNVQAGNRCKDFDIGWKSYQPSIIPASVKTIPLTFTGENLIRTVNIPADCYLQDIYIKIEAFGTSPTERTLTITIDGTDVITKQFAEPNGFEETISINKTLSVGSIQIAYNGNTILGTNATLFARYI